MELRCCSISTNLILFCKKNSLVSVFICFFLTMNTYVTIQEDEKRRQMHMLDQFVKRSNLAQNTAETV